MRQIKRIPTISVLMPVHNGELYLAEAIESIRSQIFDDFELVIVDDGSTDSTQDIIKKYKDVDHRIMSVRIDKAGIVEALNIGLRAARGKYIARMDADDISARNRLSTQIDFLEKNRDIVVCGSYIEKFGAERGVVRVPITDQACRMRLLTGNCFAHSAVTFRSDILKEHSLRYLSDFEYAEDYKLWSELSKLGGLANISEPLLKYRVHDSQISSVKRSQQRAIHSAIAAENISRYGMAINCDEVKQLLWPTLRPESRWTDVFKYVGGGYELIQRTRNMNEFHAYMVAVIIKTVAKNIVKPLTER